MVGKKTNNNGKIIADYDFSKYAYYITGGYTSTWMKNGS